MFTFNKLWLAVATLTAIGTVGIVPAQAITFNFHFASPLPPNNVITGKGGSLTIDDQIHITNDGRTYTDDLITNMDINQWAIGFTTLNLANGLGPIRGGSTTIGRLPGGWMFAGYGHTVELGNYARTGISWKMNLFSGATPINGSLGGGYFWARFGLTQILPPSYDGGIIIDSISLNPTPKPTPTPPPNSVPEPSSVSALLLATGWLLWIKLKDFIMG